MSRYAFQSIAALSLSLIASASATADIRHDYELTVASVVKALQGWQLYENEKFPGSFNNGRYTDPDPKTKVNDFWSDGLIAKLDRDNNGHFETIFIVAEKQLVYAGSIGGAGTFIHVARDYKKYLGQPAALLIKDAQRQHVR